MRAWRDANNVCAEAGRKGLSTLRKRSRTTNLDPPTALLARPDRFRTRFVDHERHPGITPDIPDLVRLVQPRTANFDAAGNGVDCERHRMDLGCAVGADARQSSIRCELKYRYSISVNISGG